MLIHRLENNYSTGLERFLKVYAKMVHVKALSYIGDENRNQEDYVTVIRKTSHEIQLKITNQITKTILGVGSNNDQSRAIRNYYDTNDKNGCWRRLNFVGQTKASRDLNRFNRLDAKNDVPSHTALSRLYSLTN